ncbi:MAG TPA: DUF21 domain-containing protein, partial [Actinomycetes bacterium]|nr:DUF21 domain-containing protein [Actinomycetes bacterium]
MNSVEITFVVVAAILVVLAGLFAGAEVALSRVSRTRVEEYVRQRRRAADRLQQVVGDPPRYLNVLLLLRTLCEITATVLVSLVCLALFGESWQAVLVAAGIMLVLSYVVI